MFLGISCLLQGCVSSSTVDTTRSAAYGTFMSMFVHLSIRFHLYLHCCNISHQNVLAPKLSLKTLPLIT